MLIIFRILQGLGGGILLPVEQLILRRTFQPSEHRLAMGIYGATVMIGPALGPIIGGYIIDNYDWPLIFLVNIPVGIFGLFMINRFVSSMREPASIDLIKPDWLGITLLVSFISPLVWLMERGDRLYWFETQSNVLLLFISLSSLAMFCAHELTIKNPAVNLMVLRNRIFSSAVIFNFLLGIIVSSTLFMLPIYMQQVLKFTATQAGVSLVPRAILMMLMFPLVGILLGRIEAKFLIITGMLLGFLSAAMMSKFTHESGIDDVMLPQMIQGVAVALILTSLGTIAYKTLPKEHLPSASGLEAIARQLGSTVGISIFAAVLNHFQLAILEQIRDRATLHNSIFYNRFSGVFDVFFQRTIADPTLAMKRAFNALNGRLYEQVNILSYLKVFEWIAVLFLVMLVITIFTKLDPKK
jgi:DHA2 family multidrug resistance protein